VAGLSARTGYTDPGVARSQVWFEVVVIGAGNPAMCVALVLGARAALGDAKGGAVLAFVDLCGATRDSSMIGATRALAAERRARPR
jgi:hypothetical protein